MATPITTLFTFPGNITGFVYAEDGSQTTASVVAVGGGSGTSQVVYYFLNDPTGGGAAGTAALPALEHAVSYQQVTDPAIIAQLGQADAKLRAGPVTTLTLTVRGDIEPVPGSYTVGDHARVAIDDVRFPPSLYPGGYDDTWRITQLTITPPTSGGQDESVTVTLAKFADV